MSKKGGPAVSDKRGGEKEQKEALSANWSTSTKAFGNEQLQELNKC